MQTYLDFNQYIRQGEPAQKDKAEAWRVAIGLQAVDGLKTSEYLQQTARRNIEGDITIDEARELLKQYYISKTTHNSGDADNEEADKVSVNITKILSSGTFDFSANGIISLHRRIFDGVFKHAGRIRDYDISKKEWGLEGASVSYLNWEDLRQALEYDIEQERSFCYKGISREDMIAHLTGFVSGIWQIHAFREGNTRTTAVFTIQYLRSVGFDINNDLFADHSWYFRNALVRANYKNLVKGIDYSPIYLERFFRNLLLGEHWDLRNRYLHINPSPEWSVQPNLDFEAGQVQDKYVTLWNLNYGTDVVKDVANDTSDVTKEFVKEFVKEPVQFTKEFVKAQRRIYKLISTNPQINIAAIAENLSVSTRQVQKYLRRLTELQLIAREGGRKNGFWRILDKDYDDFFERI